MSLHGNLSLKAKLYISLHISAATRTQCLIINPFSTVPPGTALCSILLCLTKDDFTVRGEAPVGKGLNTELYITQ